jgi:hypothetical protein
VSTNRQAGQRGAAGRGGGASRSGGNASRGTGGRGAGGRSASARGADGPVTPGRGSGGRGSAGRGSAGRGSAGRGSAGRGARRPLPPGQALYTPGASAGRRAIERRSAALLVYLHQLPRWVPPVVLGVLLITGLAVHGIGGGIALIAVALMLAWLAVVSWPSLSPGARAVRTLAIALVIAAAVAQVVR